MPEQHTHPIQATHTVAGDIKKPVSPPEGGSIAETPFPDFQIVPGQYEIGGKIVFGNLIKLQLGKAAPTQIVNSPGPLLHHQIHGEIAIVALDPEGKIHKFFPDDVGRHYSFPEFPPGWILTVFAPSTDNAEFIQYTEKAVEPLTFNSVNENGSGEPIPVSKEYRDLVKDTGKRLEHITDYSIPK